MTTINVQGIWVLSALDKLISENKKDPAAVCLLFEKKQMVLQLLQNKKIDSVKYKSIVAKAYKEETGVVKLCAEEDIRKLKDPKDDKLVQQWFKEMIENTGIPFENQQKLYNYYKTQQTQTVKPSPALQPLAKPTQPTKVNPIPEKIPQQAPAPKVQQGPALQEIASFKVLDSMLDEYAGPSDRYQQLLERKKKLLDLAKRKDLTAEKYKTTLQLLCKRLSGTDLASEYKFELEGIDDFHDGNVKNWFVEILEETQFSLEMQTEKLTTLRSSAPRKGQQLKKEQHHPANYRSSIRQSVKAHVPGKKGFDIGDLNSFRVFDEQMEEQADSKDNYKAILEKKKKFLDLAKKGSLNGEKYKSLLIKFIAQTKNEQIKESMEFQLSELSEFHNNNLAEWWQDVLSNAELMLEDQENTLNDLIQGKKIKPKKDLDDDAAMMKFLNGEDDDDADIHLSDDQELKATIKPQPKKEAQKQIPKKEPPSAPSNPPGSSKVDSECSQIFSLKALDELMTENMKNPSKFCLYFERKQAIFEMMQRGEIDAKKYKVLQEKTLASTKNQKLKQCVEMDLFDLKDMCSGNVDEWFESLINDAGFNYEDQQEMYQKLKGKGGANPAQKSEEGQARGRVVLKQNPNIAEVVCFTALAKLFQHSVKALDIVYYKELCAKRQKLIELVSQNRLLAVKYKQINRAAANKTTNDFLKACIEGQIELLSSKFNGNQQDWFQQLKKQLTPDPPVLTMPENPEMKKINSLPVKDKAQYLAKKMAPYETLLAYNKENAINYQNPALSHYAKVSKKQAFKAISMLAKDPEMDIYNLAQKLFPQINADIFYGGNLPGFRKKAEASLAYFVQEIAAIKDYASKIKKATNPNNLENAKKEIAECQSHIAFLKSWPGKQLVAFPLITQEKIERYNLDLNTHLDKNQVEITINYIQNLASECYLKIYAGTAQKERYWVKVKNGPQKNVQTIIKLTPKEAVDLMRGELPVVVARFFEKSFWGNFNLIGEVALKGIFIRNNIAEEKANDGKHVIHYEMRVHKPTKPLVTEIMHTTLKTYPPFKTDPSIEKQLIKQCLSELK